MKFEVKKQIVTPDGAVHESIEAAKAHMWRHNLDVLGSASRPDYEAAIAAQSESEAEMPPRILALRHAIREVFLAAWPRASKGQPRPPKKGTSEPPTGDGEPVPTEGQAMTAEGDLMGSRHDDEPGEDRGENPDGSGDPISAAKRSHGKKKAA